MIGLSPVLYQQRMFDRVAPEPEMIMANRPSRKQRFACCQGGPLIVSLFFEESQKTVDDRAGKPATRLLGNLVPQSHKRKGLHLASF